MDEPWVQYNGNLVGAAYRRFLHADHQGSIIAHSSNSGAVLNSLAYDAYGIPRDANIDRFGYTGQIWLKELGLFYYKARIYSPRLGRFLQTDPVGYEDQMNMYAYVGNDPVNMVDPTGKETCPGHSPSSCIQSDNFDQARSNGQTTEASQATENPMLSGMDKVAVTGGDQEKIGFVTVDGNGNQKVEAAEGASTGSDGVRDTASAGVPQNATAVIHGHIDGVTDGVNSDGDASSLMLSSPIPNGTVSEGRLGVTEIVNGQLRFRMIDGSMRNGERRRLQENINKQQGNFYR